MANVLKFDREQTLKKVSEVFQNKGFSGTSMQDLVDTTGLNRSSIYNSFGSKLELYLESLSVYKANASSLSLKAIANSSSGRNAIERLFKFYIDEIVKDREGKGCMIVNCKAELASSGEKSIEKWLLASDKDNLEFLTKLVLQGQETGSINKDSSAEQYAVYLFSNIQGLRMTGILLRERKALEVLVQNIIKTLE